jgi:hypothetical protein
VAFLKFSPALWPFSLFSDDVSIEATIRTRYSVEYSASLSAPSRLLAIRYEAQGLLADSPEVSQGPVPVLDKGLNSKVGELGRGRFSLRSGTVLFEGRYEPELAFCGWRESHFSPRQYYYMSLTMLGGAMVGITFGVIKAKRRGVSLSRGAMRGAFLGFLFLPAILFLPAMFILLVVVSLILSLLVIVAAAFFHFSD